MEIKVSLDNHGGPGNWKVGDIVVSFPGHPEFDYLAGSEILDCSHSLAASKVKLKYGNKTISPGMVKELYLGPSVVIVERNSDG